MVLPLDSLIEHVRFYHRYFASGSSMPSVFMAFTFGCLVALGSGMFPVARTFIQYDPIADKKTKPRSSSAPAVMTWTTMGTDQTLGGATDHDSGQCSAACPTAPDLAETSIVPPINVPSVGSVGHDVGQCNGACRFHGAGTCNRGQQCPDCHVEGCCRKRRKPGQQERVRKRNEQGRDSQRDAD